MLGVTLGQKVKAGDVVATLEAMKMERALHAQRMEKSSKFWSRLVNKPM